MNESEKKWQAELLAEVAALLEKDIELKRKFNEQRVRAEAAEAREAVLAETLGKVRSDAAEALTIANGIARNHRRSLDDEMADLFEDEALDAVPADTAAAKVRTPVNPVDSPVPAHKHRATVSVLAQREAELLALKGPCTTPDCRLHYAHSGPCDLRAALADPAPEPVHDPTGHFKVCGCHDVSPGTTWCPKCGGQAGSHGLIHTRHANGGGSNRPCPNAPTGVGETGGESDA
jgi:hypothetical protein